MGFCALQKKAWMGDSMMSVWIEMCLLPQKDTLPPKVAPLLVLDSFTVDMTGLVVEKNQGLDIEVQHTPDGCTFLHQPIDVGINKLVKSALADQLEDWLDAEGLTEVMQ